MTEFLLELQHLEKSYASHKAVKDVTFSVPKGSIFGILGPNGAGKTTSIRMITGITRPDAGQILFDGKAWTEKAVEKIGYMPEERGLYKKMKVEEQILYLAQLRGMPLKKAKSELNTWFEKFDIQDWRHKAIEDLSKGMQQKIQFISTVIHQPSLLILDEPFSGLDPVNANLIQDEIYNLNNNGTTILFSTHRMEQVEQICQHIVLINDGQSVLKGKVTDIKEKYKENIYEICFPFGTELSGDFLAILPIQKITKQSPESLMVQLNADTPSNMLLKHFLMADITVTSFKEILPTFNEIFIRTVKGGEHHE